MTTQTVITCIVAIVICGAAWAQEPGTDGWRNVQDLGASGSDFQTVATTTDGSTEITVADIGDFEVGQGVMISRAFVRYVDAKVWGPTMRDRPKLTDEIAELRGYDGSSGSWTVFVVEVAPGDPATFRWTDDFALNWHDGGEVSGDWQPLSGGTEIKINRRDWGDVGHLITFSARDQLGTTIEAIEVRPDGPAAFTLKDPANRSGEDAVVRHNDTASLQAALTQAVAEKRNVFIPIGHYMISNGLTITNPSTIEVRGESSVDTVIDISEGTGTCIKLVNGQEVTLRSLRFVGHSGVDVRRQMGSIRTNTAQHLWGFYLKHCNAVGISNTARVLCDNCHATKMSAECFYSSGRSRKIDSEPAQYTKEITYYRCSVENCSRNAFNNNDLAEGTSVLQCRIRDVGGCTWEGASRFVRFIGNYVRNGGTVAMGNIRSRGEYLEQLGTGQHIIADNVFETGMIYGGCAVRLSSGGTQTIVRNNLFINYGTSGIEISGQAPENSLPSRYGIITGNIMDMTDIEEQNKSRFAIAVSAPDVIVSDNQIYVRGECDDNVTAIKLLEPMVNLKIHDNQISNCGWGIKLGRATSTVKQVVDERHFISNAGRVPMERRLSHRYRGWGLAWVGGTQGTATIEDFDPEAMQFTLTEPLEIKQGWSYQVFPTRGVSWAISNNTISGCRNPVALDSYGSASSMFNGNLITRGETTGVPTAVDMRGRWQFTDNRIVGFDEDGSNALTLQPDPLGRPPMSVFLRNSFERCANVVAEAAAGLWSESLVGDNLFVGCGGTPDTGQAKLQQNGEVVPLTVAPRQAEKASAGAVPAKLKVDGDVSEWPWDDDARVMTLEQSPQGGKAGGAPAFACAARGPRTLYLAIRVPLPEGATASVQTGGWRGDGVEVSFRNADPDAGGPIFVQWGSTGGTFESSPAGGASAEQVSAMQRAITYAAKAGEGQWSCEWVIPLSAIASTPDKLKTLMFNIGVRPEQSNRGRGWGGTGADIFRVDSAGMLMLDE